MGQTIHQAVPPARHTMWDHDIAPTIEVDSGATITLATIEASGGQFSRHSTRDDVRGLDFSAVNPVTGPIYVTGASPGDTLEVDILDLRADDWGWTAIIPGFGLLSDDFPDPWFNVATIDSSRNEVTLWDGMTLPLRPFPGTIGVAPAEAGSFSVVPPTRWGGNLDIKHLVAGTRLLLPVGVEGALLSVGDTHAAMGDGEVCGTAVEASMELTLRVSVIKGGSLTAPQFIVPRPTTAPDSEGAHVCLGVAGDLYEATRAATRSAIDFIVATCKCTYEEAYALVSVGCDLRLHEVVNAPNWVVGCFIPTSITG